MTGKWQSTLGGFTLVELMISMVVMVIAAFAVGAVIVDAQNGWSEMYDQINSDVVTDGYVARKKFDSVMRMASSDKIFVSDGGSSIEVYYYASTFSSVVDRYVSFYEADGDLNIEYGTLVPRATISVETVCENVTNCTFQQVGRSAQMILVLDDGEHKNTIITSAVTHN